MDEDKVGTGEAVLGRLCPRDVEHRLAHVHTHNLEPEPGELESNETRAGGEVKDPER